MKATVSNTHGILHLILNAVGRNRSVYEESFSQSVDPTGTHIMGMQFPHNDVEMRTQWFCKMKNTDIPAEIWLDVDFTALEKATSEIELFDEDR
jgi:hypothetical protein